jgi:hypothetical protein
MTGRREVIPFEPIPDTLHLVVDARGSAFSAQFDRGERMLYAFSRVGDRPDDLGAGTRPISRDDLNSLLAERADTVMVDAAGPSRMGLWLEHAPRKRPLLAVPADRVSAIPMDRGSGVWGSEAVRAVSDARPLTLVGPVDRVLQLVLAEDVARSTNALRVALTGLPHPEIVVATREGVPRQWRAALRRLDA